MMQTLAQQYCGMLKKVSNKAAGGAHTAGVPVGYIEDVCAPRTQLGAFFSFPQGGSA
jgi:hypothetical protein